MSTRQATASRHSSMMNESNGQQFTSTKDIFRVFRALQLTHSLLSLKFHGDKREYSSLVIHSDLGQELIVIDELIPDAGNQRLRAGEPFTLLGVYEGIHIHCKFDGIRTQNPTGYDHAFGLGFPRLIHHKQRRDAYRARIDQYDNSCITLQGEARDEPIRGKMIDLSTSGLGVEFSHFIRPEIELGEKFFDCSIDVNQDFVVRCSLIARHPRYEKSTGLYFCGFEFHGLSRLQQKHVDRYIIELQLNARRGEIRRVASGN